ncbi:dienelactone hydrolase [Gonapodya prolifera JEL478]|uniref:Dienelactone hydrolase n=1 Tax=Gonapodya prolifera (strain JEL478) TaxID=1344416 RepID=A0A139AJI9_GONPJ|nr:dienelactone hydrolase [Gonapodya prolifera JEL478]|eukprot:KXS16714.1 dienelactone hydrolase [Gonapodya prolifera JEL478]
MAAVTFGNDIPGYLAGDASTGAAVIVLQEWWGLNDNIRDITRRVADALPGLALAIDLYRGRVTSDPDEANHLMDGLDWPNAVEDVRKAVVFLKEKGAKKVGITGFCMGGALTIAGTVLVPELSAGVCFYGIPPKVLADPAKTAMPTQYHFGSKDAVAGFSDLAAAEGLKKDLTAAGKDVSEFWQYAEGGHAFMNATGPGFNKLISAVAWNRTIGFFQKHLVLTTVHL